MTVHKHAAEFKAVEEACDAAVADIMLKLRTPDSSGAAADLHHQEAWYQHHASNMAARLAAARVTPLAMLRKNHWHNFLPHFGLFQMDIRDGHISVPAPQDWLCEFTVRSHNPEYLGATEGFAKLNGTAMREACDLSEDELVMKLMPNYRSLKYGDHYGLYESGDITDGLDLHVALPPVPPREQTVMLRLKEAGIHYHIAAVAGAICFTPPLSEQLRGQNDVVEEFVTSFRNDEPIIVVEDDDCDAVALCGHWGDFIMETKAVEAAISMS